MILFWAGVSDNVGEVCVSNPYIESFFFFKMNIVENMTFYFQHKYILCKINSSLRSNIPVERLAYVVRCAISILKYYTNVKKYFKLR